VIRMKGINEDNYVRGNLLESWVIKRRRAKVGPCAQEILQFGQRAGVGDGEKKNKARK